MLFPFFPVYIQEGVPVPNSSHYLEVEPKNERYLRTNNSNSSKPGEAGSQVIIGICDKPIFEIKGGDLVEHINSHVVGIGVLAQVAQKIKVEQGPIVLHLRILGRVNIDQVKWSADESFFQVELDPISEGLQPEDDEVYENFKSTINMLVLKNAILPSSVLDRINNSKNPIKQIDWVAEEVIKTQSARLGYLAETDNSERIAIVLRHLIESPEFRKLKDQRKKPKRMEPPPPSAVQEQTPDQVLAEQILSLQLPKQSTEKLAKEVDRLKRLPNSSTEYFLLLDYLTWIAEIPWGKTSKGSFRIQDMASQMDISHHGLLEVKDQLIEYMAIEQITNQTQGNVMCFAGPQGTGKTTIAKTIAEVANRKLVKIALGGLTDEAELRGHRRTYVASRPGRIVTGLKSVGTMDPVFLLDEIDKIAAQPRGGDPTAALLEILDPEQQNEFIDRYVEIPIDLSKAMFICTANEESNIPGPLRDRMEIIHFRDYTRDERLSILTSHIIPKSLSSYQLGDYDISFSDELLHRLTETVSVRQIEKQTKKLLRRAVVQILTKGISKIHIDKDFNGPPKDEKQKKKLGFS